MEIYVNPKIKTLLKDCGMDNDNFVETKAVPMVFQDHSHHACSARLKSEGGKARCCSCEPHDECVK